MARHDNNSPKASSENPSAGRFEQKEGRVHRHSDPATVLQVDIRDDVEAFRASGRVKRADARILASGDATSDNLVQQDGRVHRHSKPATVLEVDIRDEVEAFRASQALGRVGRAVADVVVREGAEAFRKVRHTDRADASANEPLPTLCTKITKEDIRKSAEDFNASQEAPAPRGI